MYYRNMKEATENADARIKEYRYAAALFPELCMVIRSFDGKVYNCRFDKAIREMSERKLYVSRGYSNKWISVVMNGGGRNEIVLMSINVDKLNDGKRIPAELMIDDARERRANILKNAAELEEVKEKADAMRQQVESIKKMLSAVTSGYGFEALEMFGLRYRVERF